MHSGVVTEGTRRNLGRSKERVRRVQQLGLRLGKRQTQEVPQRTEWLRDSEN